MLENENGAAMVDHAALLTLSVVLMGLLGAMGGKIAAAFAGLALRMTNAGL